MAPNPFVIPRQRPASTDPQGKGTTQVGLSVSLLLTSGVVLVAATLPWAKRWLLSGSAIESLLLIYGSSNNTRILPEIPLWTLLTSLNLLYAVSSTSWLLYGVFAALCYPGLLLTCLFEFQTLSDFARKCLRRLLRGLHFTRDKIAIFNLPALEIDTDVHGLFVARGVTLSLSSLTIVAHGLELGLKLDEKMELALYVDRVDIQLFRRILVGEVYGNIKGGESEMTFGDLDTMDVDDESIFQSDTALLRAATNNSDSLQPPRPSIRHMMTGGGYVRDSSVQEGLQSLATLSPDDAKAEQLYNKMLEEITETSQVRQARRQVDESAGAESLLPLSEKELRAAVCARLQDLPSVPHPPARSVRVTTLQNMTPPRVREFLHRLPGLLRLLLTPLSYFHPINISAISAAGSGKYLTSMIQEHMFKHYASQDAEIRRLERKISSWLASANFSAQLLDVVAIGRVSLSSAYDIITYLHCADILAYRTVPESGSIREVARLGGADATFTIPSFLLPHHEHLLPAIATSVDLEEQTEATEEADGKPNKIQKEQALERMKADETEVTMSVHASLPACFDQSLLNFVAALVKATKVIELEKTVDESRNTLSESETDDAASISSIPTPTSPTFAPEPIAPSRTGTGFKTFAAGIRQNIKDARTGESIKELARDLHQSTKVGVKKAVVGGMVNDRWIAKIVGKIAATLEKAQGELGYSGAIPVPLGPYRAPADLPAKIVV